jgi:protein SCO1/2
MVSRKRIAAGIALAATIAAAAAGAWLYTRPAPQEHEHFIEVADGVYRLATPDEIAPFRLQRHDDTPFDNASLRGKWSFLFFGFTNCPDVCPTTLAALNEVQRSLSQRPGGAGNVQFVFVSVDPERDKPRLKEYATHFNPAFWGVTGEASELAKLSDSVGVKYHKEPGATPDNYFMDHSSAMLLISPDGRLHAVFAAPHVPETMLKGYLSILSAPAQ